MHVVYCYYVFLYWVGTLGGNSLSVGLIVLAYVSGTLDDRVKAKA